jgi:hypothetical protein
LASAKATAEFLAVVAESVSQQEKSNKRQTAMLKMLERLTVLAEA